MRDVHISYNFTRSIFTQMLAGKGGGLSEDVNEVRGHQLEERED